MSLSSLIEELCTKEENNKGGCTLTFRGQCNLRHWFTITNCLTKKLTVLLH